LVDPDGSRRAETERRWSHAVIQQSATQNTPANGFAHKVENCFRLPS
jgi:hypothetical protein